MAPSHRQPPLKLRFTTELFILIKLPKYAALVLDPFPRELVHVYYRTPYNKSTAKLAPF